jgi:hypothetical protein
LRVSIVVILFLAFSFIVTTASDSRIQLFTFFGDFIGTYAEGATWNAASSVEEVKSTSPRMIQPFSFLILLDRMQTIFRGSPARLSSESKRNWPQTPSLCRQRDGFRSLQASMLARQAAMTS